MTATRRIGILGGTFDPIHWGHLEAGFAAEAALGLMRMLVVTAGVPPHRPQPFASSYHRFAMAAMAVAGRDGWRATDIELRDDQRSYTSATLRKFHERGYSPFELFFVIGSDAFVEITSWKDYPSVLNLSHFAVVARPGFPLSDLPHRLPTLAKRMVRPELDDLAHVEIDPLILLIDAPTADVSSTAIRDCCAGGKSIAGLVPDPVRQHIEQHGLYSAVQPGRRASDTPANPAADKLHEQG
jgi:nicotinate-nucleotide adenylyltransferase